MINDQESKEEIDRKFRMYFKCEDPIVQNEPMYNADICNMKDSEIWQTIYGILNIKYKNLWELPISKLDILLEKEFYDLRKP